MAFVKAWERAVFAKYAVHDSFSRCDKGYGGKNCSVELIGCNTVTCLNNGKCKPFLLGESDHRANCTCEAGFHGNRCEHSTTVSFNGTSHIKVNSAREDGYELHLWFRTTLANGLLAIGKGNYIEEGNYFSYFILSLQNG